jgi:hypothetical protein
MSARSIRRLIVRLRLAEVREAATTAAVLARLSLVCGVRS